MATKIGALLISLGLDSAQFKSGLTQSERDLQRSVRSIEKTGDKLKSFGAKMSLAVSAPLVALGKKAVDGFLEQERAMADVTAALKSMGNASGKTAVELGKTADKLELNSLFDAEVILKQVTAQLLTFGNVAGDVFDRAQQAALDMAQRLGTEPQAAAIMLGKALNDPVKGITALTRVGVTFTEGQKAQIKAMTEAGNRIGAQKLILSELEREYAGAAKAAADTSPWRQAQVAIGQAMDTIGAAIIPIVKPAAEAVASLARAFSSLPEPLQKALVAGAALAVAFGPLLVVAGSLVTVWAPFIAVISSIGAQGGVMLAARAAVVGLGAAIGPILGPIAVFATAGLLIYENWDKIAPVLTDVATGLGLVEGKTRDANDAVETSAWVEFGTELKNLATDLQAVDNWIDRVYAPAVSAKMSAFWAAQTITMADVRAAWNTTTTAISDFVTRIYTAVKTWVSDKLNAVWDGVQKRIDTVKGWFHGLYDAVVGHSYIPDMVDGIAQQMARLDQVMVAPAKKGAQAVADGMRQMASDVSALLDRLFPASAALKQYREELALLEKARASGTIDADTFGAARGKLDVQYMTGSNDNPAPDFLADVKTLDGGMTDVGAALDTLGKKATTVNVAIKDSFKDMADKTIGTLQNLANSIKSGSFLDILSSVFGVLTQLTSIGAFGKEAAAAINKAPAYASGTDFHPGGLAVVGERGPELVSLPRGSSVYPTGTGPSSGTQRVVIEDTTGLFKFRVQQHAGEVVQSASGALMNGGANIAAARSKRSASRRVA